MKMVKVDTVAVGMDKTLGAYVVLLQGGEETKALPIFTGPFEAGAISMALEHFQAPSPLVHDLLKTVIDGSEAKVEQVEIVGMEENYYLASVELTFTSGKHVRVDARPSDAIALALKSDAPIYIANDVMDRSGVTVEHGEGVDGLVKNPPENPIPEIPSSDSLPKPTVSVEIPMNGLQARLEWLVREEAYEAAAEVRDLLQKEKSPPSLKQ